MVVLAALTMLRWLQMYRERNLQEPAVPGVQDGHAGAAECGVVLIACGALPQLL